MVYTARKMARTETRASHFALVICLLLRAEGVFFRTLACDGRGLPFQDEPCHLGFCGDHCIPSCLEGGTFCRMTISIYYLDTVSGEKRPLRTLNGVGASEKEHQFCRFGGQWSRRRRGGTKTLQ
jgi:hypothetical protein